MNMPALTLKNINLTFARHSFFKGACVKHMLKNVSFTVNKGESVGIIGRNGAGKTTLLRLMAGIFMPDSGIFDNHGLSVSLLSFAGGIFPECSAYDNAVILLMLQQNMSQKEAEALMPRIAAFAGVQHAMRAPLKTFSSGMLVRLKFAVSTQANPDVLLADEVLAVGDIPFMQKCYAVMEQRLKKGETLVFVSHSVSEIASKFSRAIWIENGAVMADGPAADITEQYLDFCAALPQDPSEVVC